MTVTAIICGVLFTLGAVTAALRLRRGPGLLDRAAALDVLLAIVVGVVMLYAAVTGSDVILVVGVVVALLGFLGTAGLARLLPQDEAEGSDGPAASDAPGSGGDPDAGAGTDRDEASGDRGEQVR